MEQVLGGQVRRQKNVTDKLFWRDWAALDVAGV